MTIMANYNNHIFCVIFLIALVVLAPQAKATVTCGTVATSLTPCLNYLQAGASGAVPGGCCTGIKTLNGAAQSTPDRQMVCQCLKSAAKAMPNVNVGLASSIPPKCGVNIPYKLDPSTDCSSYVFFSSYKCVIRRIRYSPHEKGNLMFFSYLSKKMRI